MSTDPLTDAMQRRARRHTEWLEQQAREAEGIKQQLAEKHGIPRDTKFEKAWNIAWELGHSSGFSEVECYFNYIVELIKP